MVLMPEATMNKDHRTIHWQHHIWFSGKVLCIKPESKASSVQETAK